MIRAVRDMVLIRLQYAEKMRSIIVPDKAKQYSGDFWGEVVSVGPDSKYNLKPGDKMHFLRLEGFEVNYNGEKLLAIQNKWIWGVER